MHLHSPLKTANPFLVDESRQWPTPIPRMADGLIAWSRFFGIEVVEPKHSENVSFKNNSALGPQVKLIRKKYIKMIMVSKCVGCKKLL